MGRKSLHTPEQLKALFIQATLDIIEERGVAGLSARSVAKRVGYSPGTIYNIFENLDALIFSVEVRVLDDLCEHLMAVQTGVSISERLPVVARAYMDFAEQRPHAWSLLFEHIVAGPTAVPPTYTERIGYILQIFDHVLRVPVGPDAAGDVRSGSSFLFCLLTGLGLLATSPKLNGSGAALARRLLESYLAGEILNRQPGIDPVGETSAEASTGGRATI